MNAIITCENCGLTLCDECHSEYLNIKPNRKKVKSKKNKIRKNKNERLEKHF